MISNIKIDKITILEILSKLLGNIDLTVSNEEKDSLIDNVAANIVVDQGINGVVLAENNDGDVPDNSLGGGSTVRRKRKFNKPVSRKNKKTYTTKKKGLRIKSLRQKKGK